MISSVKRKYNIKNQEQKTDVVIYFYFIYLVCVKAFILINTILIGVRKLLDILWRFYLVHIVLKRIYRIYYFSMHILSIIYVSQKLTREEHMCIYNLLHKQRLNTHIQKYARTNTCSWSWLNCILRTSKRFSAL